jgi:hypothetical protein
LRQDCKLLEPHTIENNCSIIGLNSNYDLLTMNSASLQHPAMHDTNENTQDVLHRTEPSPTEFSLQNTFSALPVVPNIHQEGSTHAALEQYIIQAETYALGASKTRASVFKRKPGIALPVLSKATVNRVLIYVGCFNPPHRAHLELLCHTFFRADNRTIAAFIMPGDTKAARKKAATEIEGRSLVLSKTQRIHLWEEDKAFALFTWLWPGQQRDVDLFIMKICELAKQDGFHIEFTDLVGSDHIQMLEQGKRNWGAAMCPVALLGLLENEEAAC